MMLSCIVRGVQSLGSRLPFNQEPRQQMSLQRKHSCISPSYLSGLCHLPDLVSYDMARGHSLSAIKEGWFSDTSEERRGCPQTVAYRSKALIIINKALRDTHSSMLLPSASFKYSSLDVYFIHLSCAVLL